MLRGLIRILNAEVQASHADSPARWLPVPPEQRSKHAGGGKESLPPELRQILSSESTATGHRVRKRAQLESSVISDGGESLFGGTFGAWLTSAWVLEARCLESSTWEVFGFLFALFVCMCFDFVLF